MLATIFSIISCSSLSIGIVVINVKDLTLNNFKFCQCTRNYAWCASVSTMTIIIIYHLTVEMCSCKNVAAVNISFLSAFYSFYIGYTHYRKPFTPLGCRG